METSANSPRLLTNNSGVCSNSTDQQQAQLTRRVRDVLLSSEDDLNKQTPLLLARLEACTDVPAEKIVDTKTTIYQVRHLMQQLKEPANAGQYTQICTSILNGILNVGNTLRR